MNRKLCFGNLLKFKLEKSMFKMSRKNFISIISIIFIIYSYNRKLEIFYIFSREQLVTDVLITITAPHGRYSWKDHCVNPIFEVLKDGFQTLTIPFTSIYKIEIVAPGTSKQPGDRIIGKFDLEMGQKITAAIGQPQLFGFNDEGGSGGSFLVLKTNKEQKVLLAAGVSAHTGNIQDYLKTIKEYYNWGVGGGFGGFLEGTAAGRDGIFRGSFSADPNAKFDKHYVEYGYCKIEKVDE